METDEEVPTSLVGQRGAGIERHVGVIGARQDHLHPKQFLDEPPGLSGQLQRDILFQQARRSAPPNIGASRPGSSTTTGIFSSGAALATVVPSPLRSCQQRQTNHRDREKPSPSRLKQSEVPVVTPSSTAESCP